MTPTPSPEQEKPDVNGARERLAEVRRQRVDVDKLVARLRREERLNNFLANAEAVIRGGR